MAEVSMNSAIRLRMQMFLMYFFFFPTFFFYLCALAELKVYEARHYTVFCRIA